jgi:ubiquinone/menaquinone biosynthesis C-methylase UbiE
MIDPERYEIDKVMPRPDSQVFVTDLIRRMKWRPNEAILDYGCGPGTIANELLLPIAMKTHSHIYGVDNSQEMIEYAQLRYAGKDRQYMQVPMMFGDIERMQQEFMSFHLGDTLGWFPFDANFVFDKMFCIFVFHVVKNYQ